MPVQDRKSERQAEPGVPPTTSLSNLNMVVTELLYPIGRSGSTEHDRQRLEEAQGHLERALAQLLADAKVRSQNEHLTMPERVSVAEAASPPIAELFSAVMDELHGVYDDPCWSDIGDIMKSLTKAISLVRQALHSNASSTTSPQR